MIEEKLIRMVYSNDHEMQNLAIIAIIENMKSTLDYNDIKSVVSRFPHKQGRKELRILAQKKHLKLLQDERRISENSSNAGEQRERDA